MKYIPLISLTILFVLIFGVQSGDIPADIKKCKVSDNECIRNKIMELFTKYTHGSPEFGMPDVSQVKMYNMTISEASGSSAVQLNFSFLDLLIKGIENTIVHSISGLDKDLKSVTVDCTIPRLEFSGTYVTNGKILILALDGSGKANFVLTDCKTKIRVKCHLENINGKNYVRIDKIKSVMEPKKMVLYLDNLVRGNKELTDAFNSVLNENWRDVWNEEKPGIDNSLGKALKQLIEPILKELSYDDFFLKTD